MLTSKVGCTVDHLNPRPIDKDIILHESSPKLLACFRPRFALFCAFADNCGPC